MEALNSSYDPAERYSAKAACSSHVWHARIRIPARMHVHVALALKTAMRKQLVMRS
jgi:hypothetical protein